MLTSLRIQNFRSIRDASVKLGQVNLFIGPNNSGKSNFLKGIAEAAQRISKYPDEQDVPIEWYEQSIPRGKQPDLLNPVEIIVSFSDQITESKSCEVTYSVQMVPKLVKSGTKTELKAEVVSLFGTSELLDLSTATTNFKAFPRAFHTVWQQLADCLVYKLEPASFEVSVGLSYQPLLKASGANIANFINTLSQNHENLFSQLKKDFASCVGNLVSVSTPPDPLFQGNLKLKFFDATGNSYWAEEVSEGVLYFLALLCIVHQPDPPKLLLLEEPEKGIHPRRIREVMDFIFELARMRDIQIILTSHSPYVVDYFADIPECISVFDRDPETSETVIHNAGELIDQSNAKSDAAKLPRISYTDALGEYWVSGFLGGVPA